MNGEPYRWIAKTGKQHLSIYHGWMDKTMWYIYTHTYIYEWNSAICGNMDGPWRHYAKWNKSEKNKYPMISLIGGILKKKKKKQGREAGGRKEGVFEKRKLRYREQIGSLWSSGVLGCNV